MRTGHHLLGKSAGAISPIQFKVMAASSKHPLIRIVALVSAILVLGLALIKPTIIKQHPFAAAPRARVHEGRIRNGTADVDDATAIDKEIRQVAHHASPIVLEKRERSLWTSLIISPDLEVPSEVRRIPHRRISSSPNSDPDFLS